MPGIAALPSSTSLGLPESSGPARRSKRPARRQHAIPGLSEGKRALRTRGPVLLLEVMLEQRVVRQTGERGLYGKFRYIWLNNLPAKGNFLAIFRIQCWRRESAALHTGS
jgi:hypothetical protein